jgi:hypothetical protein
VAQALGPQSMGGAAIDASPILEPPSAAVYNFSYAKYVECGGKIGFLFHPFLGYVRALQGNDLDATKRFYNSKKIPHQSYGPLIHLLSLRLMRPLPWTPNSQRMLETVVAFGKSVGCSFLKA